MMASKPYSRLDAVVGGDRVVIEEVGETLCTGTIQLFADPPTTEIMLEFPLVLAPTVVVPILLLFNLLIAWRLFERSKPGGTRAANG
jgi:hypothetical protein